MARLEIKHKCVMIAREASRKSSTARVTGKSVFIKRYHGTYRLIGVEVSKAQRSCRDIFADAQKLAHRDLQRWNRKRHWSREAKRHKVKGAHRMAVGYFYHILKENGKELTEELYKTRERYTKNEREGQTMTWEKMDEYSPFHYKKFRDIEEYYGTIMKMAG